jgi:uncharacterized protein YndB with AHSA1/START domain
MDPKDFDPGALADVACVTHDGRATLVLARDLPHEPEEVWTALTDPAQLPRWAPFTADRNLGTPGAATLQMSAEGRTQPIAAAVRRADRPKRLECTWGDDLLAWELAPSTAGTRPTLRHSVQSPDWVPRVAAGWHLCLVVAERLLDGQPIDPIVGGKAKEYGWQRLHDAYAAVLGITGSRWPQPGYPGR